MMNRSSWLAALGLGLALLTGAWTVLTILIALYMAGVTL